MGRRGIVLDARTRVLYRGARAAINGELLAGPPTAALRLLADHRAIMGRDAARLAQDQGARLYEWYVAGWLHPLEANDG